MSRASEIARDMDTEHFHAPLSANEEYLENRVSRFEDSCDRITEACDAAQSAWEELEAARDSLNKAPLDADPFPYQRIIAVETGRFEAAFLDLRDKVRLMEATR